MVIMTSLVEELKKRFPSLFDWWEGNKLRALGFREGDIDVIHDLFGQDLLCTGIIVLLAFTQGDSYPVSTIASTLHVNNVKVLRVLTDLVRRKVVYSEKFGHPTRGIDFYFADRDILLHMTREYKLASAKREFGNILQSEERLMVFVSSVMNKEL